MPTAPPAVGADGLATTGAPNAGGAAFGFSAGVVAVVSDAVPSTSNAAITCPTDTDSPAWHSTSSSTPLTTDSTSIAALSVSTSNNGWPRSTFWPVGMIHRTIRISESVVARSGIFISKRISSFLLQLADAEKIGI